MSGVLVVISGPGGVGKGEICKALKHAGLPLSVSCTTRKPRPGETDGIDYHFISRDEFAEKAVQGLFLEWAQTAREYYGTLKNEIEEIVNSGRLLILEIDVQGGVAVRRLYPQNCLSIFIEPPSMEELERRYRGRTTVSEQAVCERMKLAERELEQAKSYDYVVLNDKLETAIAEVKHIIERESSRRGVCG
jgi:guanylate kinase